MAESDAQQKARKTREDRRNAAWRDWSKAVAQAESDFAQIEQAELQILTTATSGAAAMLTAATTAVTDAIDRLMAPAEAMMTAAEQAVQDVIAATLTPARTEYEAATRLALDAFHASMEAARSVLTAMLSAARAKRDAELRSDAL